jgi:hypothetical protein
MRWRYALLPLLVFYLVIENAVPPALFPNLALWLWLGVVWSGYGKEPSGTTELDHREPALARRHDLPMPD